MCVAITAPWWKPTEPGAAIRNRRDWLPFFARTLVLLSRKPRPDGQADDHHFAALRIFECDQSNLWWDMRTAGRSRIAATSAAHMYRREKPRAAASARHSMNGRLDLGAVCFLSHLAVGKKAWGRPAELLLFAQRLFWHSSDPLAACRWVARKPHVFLTAT